MKELVDFLKTHNVWLASVSRVGLSLLAAFWFEFSAEQMAVMISFIETVFGVSQAKANIAESRVDVISERRAIDMATDPSRLQTALDRRDVRERADDAKDPR